MIFLLINAVIADAVRWRQQNEFYKAQGIELTCYTETGYVQIDDAQKKYDNQFFYHLYLKDGVTSLEGVKATDKFSVWINGGAASQMANFYEIGPIDMIDDKGTIKLIKRDLAWNKLSHLLFIDYPFNLGLSYSSNPDLVKNSHEAGDYFIQFITKFMKAKPQFAENEFYLLGESYAGHYAPIIGQLLVQQKTLKNFKGLALADGLVSPYDQMRYYASYLFNIGVIDEHRRKIVDEIAINFENAFLRGDLATASEMMEAAYSPELIVLLGLMNPSNFQEYMNINEGGAPPYITFINKHLKDYDVPAGVKEYINSNPYVFSLFKTDQPESMASQIQYLLENNIQVLIFSGQLDYIVNTPGGVQWMSNLTWKDIYTWKLQNKQFYKALNKGILETAGSFKVYKNFCQAMVYRAGHIVAADNPEATYALITKFLNGQWQ